MNEVFIPLRIMKVAGTVGELFVGLKRTRSHRSKSVTAGSLILRPSVAVLQEFCPASWKCSDVSLKPAVGKRQMTHSDLDSRLE